MMSAQTSTRMKQRTARMSGAAAASVATGTGSVATVTMAVATAVTAPVTTVVAEVTGEAAPLRLQVRTLRSAVQRLREENEQLRALAMVDPLTLLYNRRGLDIELERASCSSRRKPSSVALMIIDLDGMKAVNDAFGHPEGDRVLQAVASELRHQVRVSDTAARLGGDEFAVVMPATDRAGAKVVAERIRVAIAALGLGVTASVGVATVLSGIDRAGTTAKLVAAADTALYAAKRAGKNRVATRP